MRSDRKPGDQIASALLGKIVGGEREIPKSVSEWVAILKDQKQSVRLRRQAAMALAKEGSEAGIVALKETLATGPSSVRSAIAEALGQGTHPEIKALLAGLLRDPDELVACGAVRGVTARGDLESANTLTALLRDSVQPVSVRSEAALGLGSMDEPVALETLFQAAREIQDSTVARSVLEGLGSHPIAETQEFFRDYLKSPNSTKELRVAALEALGNSVGGVTSFLLEYTGETDPELRAAAAWALSTTKETGNAGPQLTELLRQEPNAVVRVRLYQALENQQSFDIPTILGLVRTESEGEARLAGFDLLASAVQTAGSSELIDYFDRSAAPELKSIAVTGESSQARMSAVIALRRARTAATIAALEEVARQATDPKVVEAARPR